MCFRAYFSLEVQDLTIIQPLLTITSSNFVIQIVNLNTHETKCKIDTLKTQIVQKSMIKSIDESYKSYKQI